MLDVLQWNGDKKAGDFEPLDFGRATPAKVCQSRLLQGSEPHCFTALLILFEPSSAPITAGHKAVDLDRQ